MPDASPELVELLERCVLAYERDGETGLEETLATAGDLAHVAREHVEALRRSGLLHPPELPPQIGPYRVVKRIGTGGMGAVFLAEQREPIPRRVAVKLLRPGMDSHEMLARFAIEQRTLAVLDHPGIARILDAGSIADGRPYLVMDYVPGVPLVRYCDERQLPMAPRLQLFAQVCDIVQHAHHKGIVHRDLKPSNILVTDRDGAPFPVVIDFGVAKSFANPLGAGGGLTLPGRVLGTPEYMSPEQAANEVDIDTRTDVYSLGVVLYELMTGALPFDAQRQRARDGTTMRRDSEPPTPSARITTLGDAAIGIAQARGANPDRLRRQLRGDLDWIVLRALAHDRNRRYGMPAELAADVRRHLAREPVLAGPPGLGYRVSRWCARHRLQATAAALALGSLGAGLVTSLVFWREAAASSLASAENLDAALLAVGELVQVGDSDLVAVPHLEGVRRDLLLRSITFYREFLARERSDARIAPRVAEALVRLGRMLVSLGELDDGEARLREALQRIDGPDGERIAPTLRTELRFDAHQSLASAIDHRGDRAAAAAEQALAIAAARELAGADPAPLDGQRLAHALSRGGGYVATTAPADALPSFDEAEAFARGALAKAPTDVDALTTAIVIGAHRADVLLTIGRRDDCLHAIAELRELRGKITTPASWPLAQGMLDIATLLWRCEKPADALAVAAATAPDLQRFRDDHPAVVAYRTSAVQLLNVRANCQLGLREFAAALLTQREVQANCEQGLRLAPDDVGLQRSLVNSCINQALYQDEWRAFGGKLDADSALATIALGMRTLDAMAPAVRAGSENQQMELLRLRGLVRQAEGDAAGARDDLAAAVAIAARLTAAAKDSVFLVTRLLEMRRVLAELLLDADDVAGAAPLVDAALADSEAVRNRAEARDRWETRYRQLQLLRARVCAARGDVAGIDQALAASFTVGAELDWIGRMSAAQALTSALARLPANATARPAIAERGRACIDAALGFLAKNEERGTGHGTLLVMRLRTQLAATDLAEAGRDWTAAAMAAGDAFAAASELWLERRDTRNRGRLRDTAMRWLVATSAAPAGGGLAAAFDRVLTAAGDDGEVLAALAAAIRAEPRLQALHGDARLPATTGDGR